MRDGNFMNEKDVIDTTSITGEQYARMLCGGAALLAAHADEINDLNVFPVPDGDTGTNMTKTLEGGLAEIAATKNDSIADASGHFAHGALLGARGNSGVILSQIFAGIGEELSKYDKVGAMEIAEAYKNGIKKSYASVQNPTEGTILTVFREATEYAAKSIDEGSSVIDFFKLHIEEAKRSLMRTKEILPVLAEADVVDSGGAGYLYIATGMYDVLTGKETDLSYNLTAEKLPATVNIDSFTRDSVLEFGYCTEFLLRLTTNKVNPDTFDMSTVTELLSELGGESVVAYKTDDVVKVHVHTFNPGEVLSRMQAFGEFLTVKIENMSVGHTEAPKKKEKPKKYEILAVASGDGLEALFCDMGVSGIIEGGQTSNPSIEEFIEAFDKTNAENIIVLPNNKNVILAANGAAELYKKTPVHVIKTKNLMQCYGALSVVTPGIESIDALIESISRAAAGVVGCEVTRAVRSVSIGGKQITEGDYIAISEGNLAAVCASAEEAVCEFIGGLDADEYEILSLFVGKGVSDDARAALTEKIEEEYPDFELEVYESGHEIYDYMIAIQ